MKLLKTWRLSGAIGMALLLAACSAAPATTPVATIAATQPVVDPSPPTSTALPPTAPAQSTATSAPTPEDTTPAGRVADLDWCTSPTTLTPAQTEGPYYTPNSPEKTSLLEAGMGGTPITLTGYVVNRDCEPVANAWLDFWQADDDGVYDNAGYRLRGHLFTDETGRYTLETIVPGEYPGRPPHIHVKVQAPDGSILTSQIYFPGMAGNESDAIFDSALLANVQDTTNGKVATFNFVIAAP